MTSWLLFKTDADFLINLENEKKVLLNQKVNYYAF